jgi:hypothetical protein
VAVIEHDPGMTLSQPLDFCGKRPVIGLEIEPPPARDLGRVRLAPRSIQRFPIERLIGQSPVVAWPGYSDAPDGSRFTSMTVREIVVRTTVAPSPGAKS